MNASKSESDAAQHSEDEYTPGAVMSDLAVSLILVVMAVFFDFLSSVLSRKGQVDELTAHPDRLLEFVARPFDLWAIALTLLIGYALSLKGQSRSINSKFALVVPGLSLLIILVCLPLGTVLNKGWLRIAVPDTVGVIFIVISVIYVSVRRASK